ncbi:cell surface glycoprotein CD200 receptor 1-like [Tenrec ecaudatus]|uniref:cell surface glycoprotein CD200 receptor 1-like n=1 Tax=Tenrec ecaudatus TaxID=94439 RepID=UPI003F5A8CF4
MRLQTTVQQLNIPVTTGYLSTWKILLRDNTSCYRAYRRDGNETKETNCAVKGISWVSSPEQPLALHIDPVTTRHDGSYTCEITYSGGNFHRDYDLRVLVPPEVSLVETEPGTALCQALSGKPAAQISWTPEGNCDSEKVTRDHGTVSVRSSCRWKDSNVSTVICSVSHVTGNRNLSLELHPG